MQQQETVGNPRIPVQSRYLWFIISLYSLILILGNWFDLRAIKIFGIVANAGTIIFAGTFFLSNLITEVYGYKYARIAIWWGFLFNTIVIFYGQLIIHMPSPEYHPYNEMFDTLLHANNRAILAGILSYLCSEPLNSFVMAKLKVEFNGHYLGPRFLVSTIIASSVDSVLFGVIAFYGVMNSKLLISLAFGMLVVKVLFDLLSAPLFIYLAKKLKNIEKTDIYDKGTKFNLFQLNTDYNLSANRF